MQGNLSIERMCQLAQVSRAGFYRSLQEQEPVEEDMEVRSTIQQIFAEHRRRYGYRRVSAELRRRGMLVNHKRVARLMREDNLLAVQPKAFVVTTDSDHDLEVYLNLASRMKLTGINQLWVADITYIRLQSEFVYPGGDPGCVLAKSGGLGAGSNLAAGCRWRRWRKRSRNASHRRAWCIIPIAASSMLPAITSACWKTQHDSEHEPAGEPLRQGLRFILHLLRTADDVLHEETPFCEFDALCLSRWVGSGVLI